MKGDINLVALKGIKYSSIAQTHLNDLNYVEQNLLSVSKYSAEQDHSN